MSAPYSFMMSSGLITFFKLLDILAITCSSFSPVSMSSNSVSDIFLTLSTGTRLLFFLM